jgi:hypothetical protein
MRLRSLVFCSGLLNTLQVAVALPGPVLPIQKRAVDIPTLMRSDGLDLHAYTYDTAEHEKIAAQTKAISHLSPANADFTLDKTFPGYAEFEVPPGSQPKKNMVLLATPKGSTKVVGWFSFDLGKHMTDADVAVAAKEGAVVGKTDALLGLKWVHEDYRGVSEGKGLLGAARGTPYNLNMAITEAGMQAM